MSNEDDPPPPIAPAGVEVRLLGPLRVVLDGREVDPGDWPARRAQELVALLALAPGHRLARDRVLEDLWPHLGVQAAAANLRKAAHHARRTLGAPEAVVLRGGTVELFADRPVRTDVEAFLAAAEDALSEGDPAACARAAATCCGDLLPDAPYEAWTQEVRRRVQGRLSELVRASGDAERLLEVEPTDERACREVMSTAIEAGRRHAAIRAYECLRLALARELGTTPDAQTRALYDRCTSGVRIGEPTFVGRELELAAAATELHRVAEGGTGAIVVRGTIGMGKSALCRELLQRAAGEGWRVLTAAATTSGVPYAPLSAVLEQLLAGGIGTSAELPGRTRSVLAELTPLAHAGPPLPGPLTRHQVIAALRRTLALADPAPPTVLCLEDAHLADEASADVLHQLVAAGAGCPLVIVIAVRAEWMRMSLPRGMRELARSALTQVLTLAPLGVGELERLVAASATQPAPAVAARVARRAEGSPFFALELARAAGGEELPRTVREAVTERFLASDAETLDRLARLAVADRELDLASVLALTGEAEDTAFALLDAALDEGVLVVVGARYRFRHELVRQALVDRLAPHRRLALHRDAAGFLAAAGEPAELVAHHLMAGGEDSEAAPWLLLAAERAAGLGAFADALRQTERLLAVEPSHHAGLRLQAEVLDALGDRRAPDAYAAAAVAIGEPEAQELTARRALAQLKGSDPTSALRTLEGCTPKTLSGRLAEALTLSAAAAIGVYADAATAAEKAEEARELALELGDPGAILDATWAHALAAHATGELPARLREYLRSTAALPDIATRVFDGQLCVTERMLYGGMPGEEVIAFADALAVEAERLGAARGHAFALTLRGEAGVLAGHLDRADADFADGARLHGRIGAAAGEALSLLGRAQVSIARGRPEHARPYLIDALLLARESEVGHHTLDRIYGAMVEAAPDAQAGVALVAEAESAIVGPAETCPTCRIAFIVPAAIAAARGADLQRARSYLANCETAIAVVALPPAWHAAVAEARGWLARAEGESEAARDHFRTAASGFATWGQPIDASRCRKLAVA